MEERNICFIHYCTYIDSFVSLRQTLLGHFKSIKTTVKEKVSFSVIPVEYSVV